MILSFSRYWNKKMPECMSGRSTFFPDKIISSLVDHYPEIDWKKFNDAIDITNHFYECTLGAFAPKHHTFREDKYDRWKVGMDIHFVINNRAPNYLQFAPIIKVVSIQKVQIRYTDPDGGRWALPQIYIDGSWFPDLDTLAQNDGFDSVEDFCCFFNDDWSGKIIHWTDLKYN